MYGCCFSWFHDLCTNAGFKQSDDHQEEDHNYVAFMDSCSHNHSPRESTHYLLNQAESSSLAIQSQQKSIFKNLKQLEDWRKLCKKDRKISLTIKGSGYEVNNKQAMTKCCVNNFPMLHFTDSTQESDNVSLSFWHTTQHLRTSMHFEYFDCIACWYAILNFDILMEELRRTVYFIGQ